ncbi:MAG: DNA repair exonuclease [Myxococcota bacterium]
MAQRGVGSAQLRLGIDRSTIRILHAADLHLDSPLVGLQRYEGAPVEELRIAARRAFDRLVELCETEDVDLLLLAGDLFDGEWRDYGTGLFFTARMHRLAEAGVDVVMVRGNHDAQSRLTKGLRLPSRVLDLSTDAPGTIVLDRLGVAVHGQGYAEPSTEIDLAARYPQAIPGLFNIGLLHTALDGREGHARYAPTTVERLRARGYDYWALGHVHQREVVHKAPWIVFPGNLQGRHARETGDKGATLIRVEDGRVMEVQHRALDVVRWASIRVDAGPLPDAEAVLVAIEAALHRAEAQAEGRALAARVTIQGATAAQISLISKPQAFEAEVRQLGLKRAHSAIFIEKLIVDTRPLVSLEALLAGAGPIQELLRALEAEARDPELWALLVSELSELRARLGDRIFLDERGQLPAETELLERLFPRIRDRVLPLLLEGEEPR